MHEYKPGSGRHTRHCLSRTGGGRLICHFIYNVLQYTEDAVTCASETPETTETVPSKRGEQLFKVGRVTDATVAPGVGLLRPLDHRAAAQLRQAAIVCRRELLDSRAGGESVRQAGGQPMQCSVPSSCPG